MKKIICIGLTLFILGIIYDLNSATKITVTKDTSGNVDGITKLRTANGTTCIDLSSNTRAGTFDTLTGTHTGNVVGDVTGDVTGDLTGNVTGNVTGDVTGGIVVADTIDTTSFVGLWESATGTLAPKTDTGITYNAGTGLLSSTIIAVGSNRVLEGTTAKAVLRTSSITMKDGTTGVSLKCTLGTTWNGDVIAEVDDIAKSDSGSGFTLSADGTTLTIEAASLSGSTFYVLQTTFWWNDTGTDYASRVSFSAAGIILKLTARGSSTALDLTTIMDSGDISLFITYITNA
jgi:hypothetical protein